MPNPSNRFHLWIYRARPSVGSIMHTHPPHVSALSMIGTPLIAAHMDTTLFHEDCAWLAEWPGVPIGDEEGRIISEALGDQKSILLAHHGQLTAAGTVEHLAWAMTGLVEELGYRVLATAATEQSAVQEVRKRRPDAVLMDIRLRDGSGLGAATVIRQGSKVPIVFCTSYAGTGAVQSAVQALGNTALIGKPFHEAELADLLANAVKKSGVTLT